MAKKNNNWLGINLFGMALIVILGIILAAKSISQKDQYIEVVMVGSAGEWWYSERQPPYWLANSLAIGGAELTPTGKKVAEITDISSFEEGANKVIVARVRLLVSKNTKSNTYRFKQQPLLIGSAITIYPNNTRLIGNVSDILDSGRLEQNKNITVTVKLYDRYPWFTDHIKTGDKYTDPANGKVQIEVLKKEVAFAEMTGFSSAGTAIATRNPLKRDIILTVNFSVTDRGGQIYFANLQPVKVGNELYLPMSDYNLYQAKVISIKD